MELEKKLKINTAWLSNDLVMMVIVMINYDDNDTVYSYIKGYWRVNVNSGNNQP